MTGLNGMYSGLSELLGELPKYLEVNPWPISYSM